METAVTIRQELQTGEWVVSLDLTDTYHHIPIHPCCQKFLRFCVNNRIYQYKALPMGLTDSARVFTRVVRDVNGFIQRLSISLNLNPDDWIIHGKEQSR